MGLTRRSSGPAAAGVAWPPFHSGPSATRHCGPLSSTLGPTQSERRAFASVLLRATEKDPASLPATSATCSPARHAVAFQPLRSIRLLEPMAHHPPNHFVSKRTQKGPAPARFCGRPRAHGGSEHVSTPVPKALAKPKVGQFHGAAAHRGGELGELREQQTSQVASSFRSATTGAAFPKVGPNPALKRTRSGGRRLAPISFWAKRHPPLRSA